MEEIKSLPYGRKQRVGNFSVLKYTKTFSKSQMKELREETGASKNFGRTGVPYIKVSAISGAWSVEFAAISTMYRFLDSRNYEDEKGLIGLHNLFTQWLTDTLIIGDAEYIEAKADAMKDFIGRQQSDDNKTEEDAALDEMKEMQDVLDTVESVKNELEE